MNTLRVLERWPTFRLSRKNAIKPLVLNQVREMMGREKIGNVSEGSKYLREQLKQGNLTMNDLVQMKFKFAGVGTMSDWDTIRKMNAIDRMIESASGKKIPRKYRTKEFKNMEDFYIETGKL